MPTLITNRDSQEFQISVGKTQDQLCKETEFTITDPNILECPLENTTYKKAPFGAYESREYSCLVSDDCIKDVSLVGQEDVTLWADEAACGGEKSYMMLCQTQIVTDDNEVPGADNQDNI